MKTFPRFIFSSLMVVILIGCGTATQASDPTTIPSLHSPSVLPTSATQVSSTPSLDETPKQTPGVFDDAIYYATQSVVQTKVARFPRICKENYSRPNFSPNDLWMEELCYSENDHDLVLTLSNRESKVFWKLLYRDFIPHTDFADGGMAVVRWTKDERYVYFTSSLYGSAGECFYDGWDTGSGLFRLDLQTGQITSILPVNDRIVWYGFSISPTDKRLVYGVRSLDLKILDITTGQSITIAHKYDFSQGGGYVWSSDGLNFIYSTVTYKPNHVGGENYSLRLVDAQTGNEQILFEAPDKCFSALSWATNDILVIERYGSDGRTLFEYDLNINRIIRETTATP